MYDPRARQLTGLRKSTYINIMKNYVELRNKYYPQSNSGNVDNSGGSND